MKSLPIKWHNIKVNRIAPNVYPRYFRRQQGYAESVAGHHFYIDDRHSWSEFFYEKVSDGFWLLSMEIRIKGNNHYIIGTKNGSVAYSSINILSSSQKIGYRNCKDINWSKEQVIFSSTGTISEIYLQKGTTLRCCRLIFTNNYLEKLVNSYYNPVNRKTPFNIVDTIGHLLPYRSAIRAEIFLQDRLFTVLRFEGRTYHYRPALLSILFELTAFFFRLAEPEISDEYISIEEQNYTMMKAIKILEQNSPHKFPGIAALAISCKISVSKLKRDFKKTHGITPLEYFRSLQINYVFGMLSGNEKTVKQLAMDLGFKKSSTFSKWYRKISDKNETQL
jgi:AraC-like DNA-binding protein